MWVPARITLNLFIAAIAMLLGIVLDASLFSIFRANLQRALAVPRYRPLYLHSGRRNRVRY